MSIKSDKCSLKIISGNKKEKYLGLRKDAVANGLDANVIHSLVQSVVKPSNIESNEFPNEN